MSFAAGGALAGLLLLVPLVALHLRRRGQTVHEVPSLLLWDEIDLADARGARGLRPPTLPLLLALQALALALLVLALAEPTGSAPRPRTGRVIVIDDSWRMQAPGRIAAAREDAASMLAGLPGSAAVSVVLAGESPSVLYRGSPSGARTALKRLHAGSSPAELAGALTVAGGLLGSPAQQIALIRAPEDALPALHTRPGQLRTITLPGPVADLGIFDAGARCGIGAGQGCEVYATLTNTFPHPIVASITAAALGHKAISLHIPVAADASAPLALEAEPGEQVSLRLGGGDALPRDDSALLTVPGAGNEPTSSLVTLVGLPSLALATARAFAAVPGVHLLLRTPATYRPSDARASRLVILDHWLPHGALPASPAVLLIDPPSLPEGHVSGTLDETVLSGTDSGSELLAGVGLSSLSINSAAARKLDPPRWLSPVLWSPSGVLLAAGSDGSRRLAALAFEPGQSNLAQLPALPILAANLVRWAAGAAPAGSLPSEATATAAAGAGAVDLARAGIGLGHGSGPSEAAWFLAAALAALVCEWLYWASRRPGQRQALQWRLLEGAAGALLVLALLAPELHSGSSRPTVLTIDESASIGARARSVEHKWSARAKEDECVSPCSVIRFAGATAVTAPAGVPAGALESGATNLKSAIGAAVGLVPRGGRLAVLGDGGQTRGELLDVAPLARARGVQIDWVALDGEQVPDASITAINTPGVVHLGDTVPLTLTVHSNLAATATLTVDAGGAHPASQRIELRAGDNPLLLLYTAASRGWQSFRATVTLPGDAQPANNSSSAVTDVLAEPRVLVAGTATSAATGLLAGRGLRVTATTPAGLPRSAAGYDGEDSVVLDDVPASELAGSQIAALAQAIRSEGLGLLALGGRHSFSLGGYAHSSLQQVLPVTSLVPGNLQRRNLAVELVLDHSGSMSEPAGGVEKIAMARAAAKQSAAFLRTHQDALGVVDFDITAHTLVPLQLLSSAASERHVDRIVSGLQADGGTNIYLGLKAGLESLLQSKAKQRHMILMTDGISQPANYRPLLAQLSRAHISVATVALGAGANRVLLSEIAAATGGRAYVTDRASELPRIFVKETQLSAKPVRVTGRLSVRQASDSTIVRSLLGKSLPPLAGNVVVQLKSGAQADLLASDGSAAPDPALTEWQIGAGRVVAWTPGLDSGWAGEWLSERELWNDAIRWSDRGVAPAPLTPLASGGASGTLRIDLAGAGTAAFGVSTIEGTLTGAVRRAVHFRPIGPSLYEADPGPLPPGVYRYEFRTLGSVRESSRGQIAIGYPAEYSPVTAHVSPLAQLVRQTGGRILAPEDYNGLAGAAHSLRRPLALAALVLFLIGVAGRMLSGSQTARPPSRRPTGRSRRRERALQHSG